MRRSRFSEEQIIGVLKEHEAAMWSSSEKWSSVKYGFEALRRIWNDQETA